MFEIKHKLIVVFLLVYCFTSCLESEDAIGSYSHQSGGAVLNLYSNGEYSFVTLRGDTICSDVWKFDEKGWSYVLFHKWKGFDFQDSSKVVDSYQTIFNGREIFFNPDLPPTFIKNN